MKRIYWYRTFAALFLVGVICTAALTNSGEIGVSAITPQNVSSGITLIIDPGHGGADGGAVSVTGKKESEINLAVARRTELTAAFLGTAAVMTRTDEIIDYPDSAKTIRAKKAADQKARVDLINREKNALLISIHQNKFTTPSPRGPQILYADTPGSRGFAEYMQSLLTELSKPDSVRTAAEAPADIFLMGSVSCPAILIECGFLSNPEEAERLESDDYQKMLAVTIAGGFGAYAGDPARR